jgi:hypothetical protein
MSDELVGSAKRRTRTYRKLPRAEGSVKPMDHPESAELGVRTKTGMKVTVPLDIPRHVVQHELRHEQFDRVLEDDLVHN